MKSLLILLIPLYFVADTIRMNIPSNLKPYKIESNGKGGHTYYYELPADTLRGIDLNKPVNIKIRRV